MLQCIINFVSFLDVQSSNLLFDTPEVPSSQSLYISEPDEYNDIIYEHSSILNSIHYRL